jgi:hypothetical protein
MDRMINHMINDWRPERHTKRRSAQRFEVEAEDRVKDGIPRYGVHLLARVRAPGSFGTREVCRLCWAEERNGMDRR